MSMTTINSYQDENLINSFKKRLLFYFMQLDEEGMLCPICETRFTSTIMCSMQMEPCKTQVFRIPTIIIIIIIIITIIIVVVVVVVVGALLMSMILLICCYLLIGKPRNHW